MKEVSRGCLVEYNSCGPPSSPMGRLGFDSKHFPLLQQRSWEDKLEVNIALSFKGDGERGKGVTVRNCMSRVLGYRVTQQLH